MKKHNITLPIFDTTRKKLLLFCIALIVLLMVLWAGYLYFNRGSIAFYYKNEEASSASMKIEYGSSSSFDPREIQLKAEDADGNDITDMIRYETPDMKELGVYTILYSAEASGKEAAFTLEVTVSDTKAPVFSGSQEIEWTVQVPFDYQPASHGITAVDEHDGDLQNNITYEGNVDVSKEQDSTVIYKVCDTSQNCAEYPVTVHVKENKVLKYVPEDDIFKDPRTITPNIVENPNDLHVLINKYNALPDGWQPNDLVAITSNNGRQMSLRKEAAQAWETLNADAAARGITIYVVSSYRTQAYQSSLFYNYYAVDGSNAFFYSALPRRSEHELGLAIDVSNDAQLHDDLLQTEVGRFMNEEGYKYGFILRYPEDKVNITKYGFEAWHYRYVGIELAAYLKQNHLALEEY